MSKKNKNVLCLFFAVLCLSSSAQTSNDSLTTLTPTDTILLNDGRVIITTIVGIDTSNTLLSYRKPKKPEKTRRLFVDEIFSITDQKGERILYIPDTLGENYSAQEMRYLIAGQQDGRRTRFAYAPFVANFVASAASSVTGSFFSPVTPLLFTAIFNMPRVKIRDEDVSNTGYLDKGAYVDGYKQEVYKKRRVQTLLGGGLGFLAGITTSFILKANGTDFSYIDLFSK